MKVAWKPKSTDVNIASVRYRCTLPMEDLQRRGIPIEFYSSANQDTYAAVIFSKLYDPENLRVAERLKLNGTAVILDICDNHFYNPHGLTEYKRAAENLRKMISIADVVVCSTEKLSEILVSEANLARKPIVIGDPIEVLPSSSEQALNASGNANDLAPLAVEGSRIPTLLWFGSHGSPNAPSGMLDLLRITELLTKKYRSHPFELLIVSNSEEKFRKHFDKLLFPTRYVAWEQSTFVTTLKTATAVLIPVSINPFTICKSNNRIATALYYGVPVIADKIPSYAEFGSYAFLDRWEEGLDAVFESPNLVQEMVERGRGHVVKTCMLDSISPLWERVIRSFVSPTECQLSPLITP